MDDGGALSRSLETGNDPDMGATPAEEANNTNHDNTRSATMVAAWGLGRSSQEGGLGEQGASCKNHRPRIKGASKRKQTPKLEAHTT